MCAEINNGKFINNFKVDSCNFELNLQPSNFIIYFNNCKAVN